MLFCCRKTCRTGGHCSVVIALCAGGCEGEEIVKAGAGEEAAQWQEVGSCHD